MNTRVSYLWPLQVAADFRRKAVTAALQGWPSTAKHYLWHARRWVAAARQHRLHDTQNGARRLP